MRRLYFNYSRGVWVSCLFCLHYARRAGDELLASISGLQVTRDADGHAVCSCFGKFDNGMQVIRDERGHAVIKRSAP